VAYFFWGHPVYLMVVTDRSFAVAGAHF